MKPPAFTYHRPATVADALTVLAEVGRDGKVLAGGQSLVPVLNMRLAAPGHLVDVNRLGDLVYIRCEPAAVRVGALARHAAVERDAAAYAALPLLRQATVHVADPAAELPAVLTLLSGSVVLASASGRRTVPAAEFFVGPLESALRPGELAVEALFPVPPPHTGTAWLEVSRRRGDYAVCGVGVLVTLDASRRIAAARAAYVSVGPTPVAVDLTEAVAGQPADAADWTAAGALAAARVRPEDDIHATAGYRRQLVAVLTARATASAVANA